MIVAWDYPYVIIWQGRTIDLYACAVPDKYDAAQENYTGQPITAYLQSAGFEAVDINTNQLRLMVLNGLHEQVYRMIQNVR